MHAKRKKQSHAKAHTHKRKEPVDQWETFASNPREAGIAPEQPVEQNPKSPIPPLEEQPL